MKIALIINQYPIQPRTKKVIDSIKNKFPHAEIKVLSWNRLNLKNNEKDIITIDSEAGYGNKIKKVMGMFDFYRGVKRYIKKYEPDYIHAIDWDMLLIGALSKKGSLVYEVYDIPNSSNKGLEKVMILLEKFALKKVKKVIVASEFFKPVYNQKNVYILNNKPIANFKNHIQDDIENTRRKPVIGYVGKIRNYSILKMVIEECERVGVQLIIAGDGNESENLIEFIKEKKYTTYLGGYCYEQIGKIYEQIDVIWAAYPIKNRNVKLAISNRFFEASVLGKPAIVSDKTALGNYVLEKKMGYVVNTESQEDIGKVIEHIGLSSNEMNIFKKNIKKESKEFYWENEEKVIGEVYGERNINCKRSSTGI